jgi:hypothetical protein
MRVAVHIMLVLCSCFLMSCAAAEDGPIATDPISGTWVGDFGPAFYDRNTISLELHWDGKDLTGQIKPGVQGGRMYRDFKAFPIENPSFDPSTGVVKFEATYSPRGRRYIIDAKIKNNTLTGTWNRPDENRDGDFKLTRKSGS